MLILYYWCEIPRLHELEVVLKVRRISLEVRRISLDVSKPSRPPLLENPLNLNVLSPITKMSSEQSIARIRRLEGDEVEELAMIVLKKMSNEQMNRKMQNEGEVEGEVEVEGEDEGEGDHQDGDDEVAIKQYLNRLSLDTKTGGAKSKDGVNRLHFIKLKG
jgi:hypothetical protein